MLLVTALFAGQPISLTAADRPNIVYFMSDELGYYELSCLGNPNLKTPHIDRLASEGIRFTQCLAGSSVCAPTRCCLMTGKHSGHTSVRSNGGGTPMRAGEVTMASLLKDAGYATGGFGKWGCGGRGSTGVPEDHGFDVFLGYYDQVHAHSYYPPYLVRNSKEVPLADNHGRGDGQTYSHYVIFDAALDFIREHQGGPFFCYLPVTPPHGIFSIPDDDPAWKLYADQPWPEDARRYAAMVSMVDRNVGQVVDLLQELGLDDNTVFFFSGDNGGADYFKSDEHPRGVHGANVNPETAVEFRGRKGNFYEGGLRVPYIVRWPGKIKPGQVTDHLCYFPDALPTVCELTGIQPPSDIDGVSFASTLLGEAATGHPQQQHESLYWEMGNQTAVRMGNWKGVRSKPQAKWELYNLESDISESHDVAADHPEKLEELKALWYYNAGIYNGLPLDDRTALEQTLAERPSGTPDMARYTYYPHTADVPEQAAVRISGRSYSISAGIEVKDGTEGVIFAHGGVSGGHSLFVKDGKLRYAFNWVGTYMQNVVAEDELEPGKHLVVAEFTATGKNDDPKMPGAKGTLDLYVDEKKVGSGEIVTQPGYFCVVGDGLCVGRDSASPVTPEYQSPFSFTGELEKVVIDVSGEPYSNHEGDVRAWFSID